MAWLVVDGTTVEVSVNDGSRVERVPVGQQRRAVDGTMRESITTRKKRWPVETALLTSAERTTLLGKLEGTPPVSCSGDLLGGATNCHVADIEDAPIETLSGTLWRIRFVLLEA